MSKQKLARIVPRLRFPEFRDAGEWEVKEVGEIFTVTRGYVLSMNLVNDQISDATPYPVYSSQTKNNGLSGYYSEFLYEDAITWTTDGANAGDVNYRSGKFYCTNVCGVLINKEGYTNLCVASLIDRIAKNHVSYVGNPKLMNGIMSKIRIPIPSFVEQQKISACLTTLDDLIGAATERLDALKQHKHGLMQQLFPAEGETVPRLRFPEFRDAGEWERSKIESICSNIYSGGTPTVGKKEYYGGSIPFVRSAEISKEKTEISLTDLGLQNSSAKLVRKGAILVALYGANSGDVALSKLDGAINQAILCLQSKHNNSFIYHYLNNIKPWIVSTYIQGGQGNLSGEIIKSLTLLIPRESKEQQKIAACLTALDDLISAQTQKIAKLKTHKRGLMQQLFPAVDETHR